MAYRVSASVIVLALGSIWLAALWVFAWFGCIFAYDHPRLIPTPVPIAAAGAFLALSLVAAFLTRPKSDIESWQDAQQKSRSITAQVESAEGAWTSSGHRARVGWLALQFLTYLPRWMISIAETIWRGAEEIEPAPRRGRG